MKKITSLLMLFLGCLGTAWAQLPDGVKASTEEAPIRYNMVNAGTSRGYYATINPNGATEQPLGSAKQFEANKAKAAFIFEAVDPNDASKGYKIKVEIGNKFYEVGLSADNTNGAEVKSQTTGNLSTWKFTKKDNNVNKWALQYLAADGTWKDGSWNMHGGAGNNLKTYMGQDQGSQWFCIEKDCPAFVEEISNTQAYIIQSGRSSNTQNEYLIYDAEAPDNVSSTWGSGKTNYDRSKVTEDRNATWVIYKGAAGTYFYNVGANKFIGTSVSGDSKAVSLTSEIKNAVEVRDKGAHAGYHFLLATNNWALNVAQTYYCHGVVSWEGGYNVLNDIGNCYKIVPTTIKDIDFDAIAAKVKKFEEETLLENLIASYEKTQGYVGGLTADDFAILRTKTTLAEAEEFANSATKIPLVAGNYYTLTNVFRQKNVSTNGTNALPAEVNHNNVSNIWRIDATTENKYSFYNPNAKGYLPNPNGDDPALSETAVDYTINDLTDAQFRLHANTNLVIYGNGHLGGWGSAGKGGDGAWYIKPVTSIEIDLASANDGAYATTYLPFGVSGVEGATAFIGKTNGNQLNMTSVTAFPAEMGVVLKGETNAQKAVLTIGEATAIEGNELQGTLLGKAYENELVLGISGGQIGFYGMNEGATIGANKAFLPATASGTQSFVLNFDGEATAIESVMGETNTDAPVYDLSGRRVVKTVKGGLYIQNGKKFIVR